VKFKNVLQLLANHFKQEKIDYALIGAFALKAYGYVRATQDVDFLVRNKHQDKIIAYLESLGYKTMYRSVGYSNHVHPVSKLGRIDFDGRHKVHSLLARDRHGSNQKIF
jgi:hypothetical protein